MSSILSKNFVFKHEKYNDICYSLILQRKGLKGIEIVNEKGVIEPIEPNILIVDLAFNSIKYFKDLFIAFPETWWLNLTGNHNLNIIGDLISSFPICLSLFDITNNYNIKVPEDELNLISEKYILRFNVTFPSFHQTVKYENHGYFYSDEYSKRRNEYLNILKNIWVLDDDFLINEDRNITSLNVIEAGDIRWNKTAAMLSTTRQQTLLNVVQIMPSSKSKRTEYKKLEILFEDYIEQARIYNSCINNNYSTIKMKYMPSFDCNALLDLPHATRLDLLMTLAISIIIPFPLVYFNDVLLALLSQFIDKKIILDIPHLPIFVKTAVIALIKRISTREIDELKENNGKLTHKILYREIVARYDDYTAVPTHPTYDEHLGFYHLRSIKRYLMDKKVVKRSLLSSDYYESTYTSTELTIVSSIPDVITRFNHINVIKQKILSTSDNYWIVFTATHVLSLVKHASYNRLSRVKGTKKIYEELRNILNLSTLKLHHILPSKESIASNPLIKYDGNENYTGLNSDVTVKVNTNHLPDNDTDAHRMHSEFNKSPVTPTAFNFFGIAEPTGFVNSISPDNKAAHALVILSNNSEPIVRNRIEKKLTIPTTRKLFTPSSSIASLTMQSTDIQSTQQESYKLQLKDSVNNMLTLNVLTPPCAKNLISDSNDVTVNNDIGIPDDYSITDTVSISMYSVDDNFGNESSLEVELKKPDSINDIIPLRDRMVQKYSQETIIDLHRRLLAEMGTIRNFRNKLNKDAPSRFDNMKILSPIQVVNTSNSGDQISSTDRIKTIRFKKNGENADSRSKDIMEIYPKGAKFLISNLSNDSRMILNDNSVMFGKFHCVANNKIPALFKDIKINNSAIAIHNFATTKLRLNSGFKLKRNQDKTLEVQLPNI